MTSERLARIRMREEEEACRIGIPKQNIIWLQYHDGMLEYANPRDLVEQVTGMIAQVPAGGLCWTRTLAPNTCPLAQDRCGWLPTTPSTRSAPPVSTSTFPIKRLHDGLRPWLRAAGVFYYLQQGCQLLR